MWRVFSLASTIVVLVGGVSVLPAAPLGTGFTYQGRLQNNGVAVTNTSPGCDFAFSLFEDAGATTQVGASQLILGVPVVDGLFTVEMNTTGEFGSNPFNGEERFLRIAVRCPPDVGFTTLGPMPKRSAVPFARYALDAPANTPWQTAGNTISYSAGDVGIGTSTVDAGRTLTIQGKNVGNVAQWLSLKALNGATVWHANNLDGGLNMAETGEAHGRLFREPGGNVGIGTTSPAGRLDVDRALVVNGNTPILDQAQESGTVATAGTNLWQSFTAGMTGMLTRVEVRTSTVNNNPLGTLEIRAGEGFVGALLTSQSFDNMPVSQAAWFAIPLSSPVPIQANQQYTLNFSSNHVLLSHVSDVYPGGSLRGVSGDLIFRTFIAQPSNVGIGTTTPTRGKVEIVGGQAYTIGPFGYLNGGGGTGTDPGGTNIYSLYATDRIAALEFNAHSDARIKRVQGRSDGGRDLKTLMAIEVTDYTMVDSVAHGRAAHKKVIGQQVKQVFPQAVSTTTNIVPDIFALTEAEAGWLRLDQPASPPLQAGDQVQLMTDHGTAMHEVVEVDGDRFQVESPLTGRVFVYGREVDDFHHVDYEEIAMLNVSATQEMVRMLQAQRSALEQQNAEIAALRARVEELESLEQRLSALESSADGKKLANAK